MAKTARVITYKDDVFFKPVISDKETFVFSTDVPNAGQKHLIDKIRRSLGLRAESGCYEGNTIAAAFMNNPGLAPYSYPGCTVGLLVAAQHTINEVAGLPKDSTEFVALGESGGMRGPTTSLMIDFDKAGKIGLEEKLDALLEQKESQREQSSIGR